MAAGLAGAGIVLLFNGLVVGHSGRANSTDVARTVTSKTAQSPAVYITNPNGNAPVVGVGPGVISMIMSRMSGIVAVDVAGPDGAQEGTGLVLQTDGVILTTSQLVAGATTITVTSSNGQEWNANLLGSDPVSGAAVISVPATDLTVIPVDSTNDLKAGALSVVVSAASESGGPFEASIGLFSGVDQAVDLGRGSSIMDAIVTDSAPPNPMGAILLDDQGKVVGILRSVTTYKGATSAVATPIALSQDAAASLLAGQEVVHAWLGLAGRTVTASDGGTGGALVSQVTPASPAALAGLRPGDLVTAIDDQAVPSMAALAEDVQSLQPGSSVILSVRRGGTTQVLSATLEGQPGLGS